MSTADNTPPEAARAPQLSIVARARMMHAMAFTPSVRNSNGVQWGIPVLFWGPPGTSKTSVFRQMARAARAAFFIFSPGEMGEGALGVVPVPAADGYLDTPAPRWSQPFTKDDGYGWLLLDEITTAGNTMQPGLMALLLERSIGGKSLGSRVRVFAAANPPDQTPNGQDLALPLCNRVLHLDWAPPTVEEVLSYLATAGSVEEVTRDDLPATKDPLAEEARVLAAWPSAFADAFGKVASFLNANAGYLHKVPSPSEPGYGKAWPSPRSWDMATRALAGASIHGLSHDETVALVAGCVGLGVARQFFTHCHTLDLPKTEDILSGALAWTARGDRLDRSFAILRSLTALASATPNDAPKFESYVVRFWGIMDETAQYRKDLALPRVQDALNAKLHANGKYPSFFAAARECIGLLAKSKVKYDTV